MNLLRLAMVVSLSAWALATMGHSEFQVVLMLLHDYALIFWT